MDLVTERQLSDTTQLKALKAKINANGMDGLTVAELDLWQHGNAAGLTDITGEVLIAADDEALQYYPGSWFGGYNAVDLNRVGSAMVYLADLLSGYGYAITVLPKTDWTQAGIPAVSDMATYIGDVVTLKAAFYGTVELPSSMNELTYTAANNIEKLLLEIELHINNMIAAFRYCGEIYCGGATLP